MPPRLDLLTKRWSTFDLPILPFLAPRVFTPWPSSIRRSHSGQTAPTKPETPRYFWDDGDDSPREPFDPPPKPKKRRAKLDSKTPQLGPPHNKIAQGRTERLFGSPRERDGGSNRTSEPAGEQDDFWAKYEETWGPRVKKRDPLEGSVASVQQVDEDVEGPELRLPRFTFAMVEDDPPKRSVSAVGRTEGDTDEPGLEFRQLPSTRVKESLRESSELPIRRVHGKLKPAEPELRHFSTPRLKEDLSGSSEISIRKVHGGIKAPEPEPPHFSTALSHSPTPNSGISIRRTWQLKLLLKEAWFAKPQLERIQQQQRLWSGLKRKTRHAKSRMQVRGNRKPRFKFVRVAPEGDFGQFNFSSSWNWRFAMLNARYDEAIKGRVRSRVVTYKNARVSRSFIQGLIRGRSSEQIRDRWIKLSASQRKQIWPDIMLATLEDYPSQALSVLEATFMSPYPAGYAVSDSLDFVVSHYSYNRYSYGAEFLIALSKAIRFFLTEAPAGHIHLLQRTLYRLLHMICFDEREWKLSTGRVLRLKRGWVMKNIYRSLVAVDHPMHENTLLQFASGLAKRGEIKIACEILQRLKDRGCDFNSPKMLSLCSTLLQRAHQKILAKEGGDPPITATEIFRFVLEAGAEPNIITYNILMKSSVDVGDHETAWQIHEMMIENGPVPDAYTYSILLNDSKLRMDPSAIKTVMGYVRQNGIRNDLVVTDILHAILLLHRQERQTSKKSGESMGQQEPVFGRLIQVYCEHFHVGPLAQIIPDFSERYPDLVKAAVDGPTNGSQDHLREPPASTLVVMITGFLNDVQSSYLAMQFYEHFRGLVLQNDPVVASLTQTTHVWNLVLMAFGKFPGLFAECSNLIGDMLSVPSQQSVLGGTEDIEAEPEVIAGADSQFPLTSEDAIAASLNPEDGVQAELQLPVNPEGATPKPPNPDKSLHAESPLPPTPDATIPESFILDNDNPEPFIGLLEPDAEANALTPLILIPPKPDVYTWSILLKIFMDQHQPRAAEKVLTMMRERGIEPSLVTWNTLATGYAHMQDTAMTVDVLRRLEQAGLSADEYTLNALGRIQNRRALIEAMRREDVSPAVVDEHFKEDLKGKLEETTVKVVEVDAEVDEYADGGLEKIWDIGSEGLGMEEKASEDEEERW
ncbi:hypothetical protein BKA65DRAFT_499157 [Rhexocercosporidium sp. MPI-PUGE-AT-0058]|nr:hypothetical protein BKA65DRAFT_499157 [Rhexocercosporidium sp. MPI-PUGE-AT-0058]